GVAVRAAAKWHAERLLARTPLAVKDGPLARKGDLVAVCVVDWPAFIDTVRPWVEFSVGLVTVAPADDAEAAKKIKENAEQIKKQIAMAADILKCFKGSQSVAYLEDGKLVTHTRVVIKDLEGGPAGN